MVGTRDRDCKSLQADAVDGEIGVHLETAQSDRYFAFEGELTLCWDAQRTLDGEVDRDVDVCKLVFEVERRLMSSITLPGAILDLN